ncbi:alpha-ketoglutarate-dependent dioxygenase (plasmid) [Raoultella ornithinolytica]|uniref:DNA oxidative demethylase AlkB n=1 Tax=Raoultella ornithinolytica TaxID=54291 RepID=UPI000849F34F|nr:DNA oxidative demethylase AlkB [Raoultella ornithinolytica]AOO59869.1 alpha-ketoglutarate-dependent dioxygenase [Raoultella ornithinolytica]
MIEDLFANDDSVPRQWREALCPGAVILRGFAADSTPQLFQEIAKVAALSPFRHLITPGGHRMSVGMTSCGSLGWMSDELGYRYTPADPLTGRPWPAMPPLFRQLAEEAAASAGYQGFHPDACLVNRYSPGARLTLHQDKNERDMTQPIVSVSLGLTATFVFGGAARGDPCRQFPLTQGDVMVWGNLARLNYHGVLPLKDALPPWPCREPVRYNLTFRRVIPA